jgi:O-antigen/teichoic acid export membrane protein
MPLVNVSARRILANTGYRLVADLGGKIASIVLFIAMARKLGESAFGVFSFSLALVVLVTALANFGQDRIVTREVARDPDRVGRYFFNTLALQLVVALPALALVIAGLALGGESSTTQLVVVLLGLGIVVELLTATCYAVFQAFERMQFVPIGLLTQRFFTAFVGVAALALGASVVTVSAVYLLGALLAFSLSLFLLLTRVARPAITVDASIWWPLMRAAIPLGIAGVLGSLLFRVDTIMLAAYERKEVVGAYGAAYRLYESTLFLSWSVGAAVYPVYARLSLQTTPPVTVVYERSLKLVSALTFPVAVGAAVLGPAVATTLYGSAYEDSGPALQLLATAIAVFPIAYVTGYLLVSQDRPYLLTAVYAIVAVENVLANLVLIPAYSLNGAAVGTSLSEVLATVLLVYAAKRAGIGLAWRRAFSGPLLASGVAGLAMLALRDQLVLAVVAGAGAYLAVLLTFERIFFPQDARTIWTSLRPAGGESLKG